MPNLRSTLPSGTIYAIPQYNHTYQSRDRYVTSGELGAGGGGGTPGGSDTQIQYNDGGSFGGDANFVWIDGTNQLQLTGQMVYVGATAGSTTFSQPNVGETRAYQLPSGQPLDHNRTLTINTQGHMSWTNGFIRNKVTVELDGTNTLASGVIPANSLCFGVVVTFSGLAGPGTVHIGENLRNQREWGSYDLPITDTTISGFRVMSPRYAANGIDVLLTASGANFSAGSAHVFGYYWQPWETWTSYT